MLFKVVFNHKYFPDGIFRAYVLDPTTACAADMGGTGLLRWLPPDRSGFGVWYDTVKWPSDDQTMLPGFNKNLHFYFLYQLTDPLFYTYTNLKPPVQDMVPPSAGTKLPVPQGTSPLALNYYFFANHDENLVIKDSLLLTKNAEVSQDDTQMGVQFYIENKIGQFTNSTYMPFGLISIIWNAGAWGTAVEQASQGANNGTKIYKPPEFQVNFPMLLNQ